MQPAATPAQPLHKCLLLSSTPERDDGEKPPQPSSPGEWVSSPSFYCQSAPGFVGLHLVDSLRAWACRLQRGSWVPCVSVPLTLLCKQTQLSTVGVVFLLAFLGFIISVMHYHLEPPERTQGRERTLADRKHVCSVRGGGGWPWATQRSRSRGWRRAGGLWSRCPWEAAGTQGEH